MSVYRRVAAAARSLFAREGIFTEADVLDAADIREEEVREGRKHAQQVLAAAFRARDLNRFGPVFPPELGGHGDYVRLNGNILYTPTSRVSPLATPNGDFSIITYASDPISTPRGGRPKNSNRDDMTEWPKPPVTVAADPPSPDEKSLQDELARLRRENAALRDENTRLRQNPAADLPPDLVAALKQHVKAAA